MLREEELLGLLAAATVVHADGKLFGKMDAEDADIDPDEERYDDTEERSPAERAGARLCDGHTKHMAFHSFVVN